MEKLQQQLSALQANGHAVPKDARHSSHYEPFTETRRRKLSKQDYDALPHRLILVRWACVSGSSTLARFSALYAQSQSCVKGVHCRL